MASFFSVSGLRLRSLPSTGRRVTSHTLTPTRSASRSFSLLRPNTVHRTQAVKLSPSLVLGSRGFFGKPTGTPPPPAPSNELKELEAAATTTPSPSADSVASTLPSDVVDPSTLSTITDAVSSVPPPMQIGDVAAVGLGGYTPWGIVESGLEYLHVTTQMPWFWTIVVGTVGLRMLSIPIMIVSARNGERMQLLQPQVQEVQKRILQARLSGDEAAQKAASLQLMKVFAENGVNPLYNLATLGVQLPIIMGLFLGIDHLCRLPVEQLKHSGMAWLPDLTVSDPTFILPAAAFVITNINIMAAKSNINYKAAPIMGHLVNLGPLLSLMSAWFAYYWPSGLALYLVTVAATNLVQVALLRSDVVRNWFGFPRRLTVEERGTPKTFKETLEAIIPQSPKLKP